MAAGIPNIAKGKLAYYGSLPAANDALIAVLLVSAGLEADTALRDYTNLSTLLAATNDEATFTGYSRQTLTGVTVTVDQTNDRVDIDCNDIVWSPTTAQALGKIVICYDDDTTSGTDTSLVPIFFDDFALTTPTTGTVTYQVAASGFARAA